MKTLIALTLSLCSLSALSTARASTPTAISGADFNGKWVATSATITDIQGKKIPCKGVTIVLTQTPGHLDTQSYKSDCGTMSSDWGPDPMSIKNGVVFNIDGDEIGTFQNDMLSTSEPIHSVLYRFDLWFDQDGNLHNVYGVKNFLGAMTVESVLKRQP